MHNDQIVGKVENLFYRFEFQSSGSKGNKPHIHCGISLVEDDELQTAGRISCLSLHFFSKVYGADFETLEKARLVKDRWDYELWKDLVGILQHHSCVMNNNRCHKAKDSEGNSICRFPRQHAMNLYDDYRGWLEEIPMPYTEEIYVILGLIGLADKVPATWNKPERWTLDESLRGGKWNYMAKNDEHFVPTIPLLSVICRSLTNVEKTNRKFQTSYLLKYISEKEV